jgi:hypothetical protein
MNRETDLLSKGVDVGFNGQLAGILDEQEHNLCVLWQSHRREAAEESAKHLTAAMGDDTHPDPNCL